MTMAYVYFLMQKQSNLCAYLYHKIIMIKEDKTFLKVH